MGFPASGKHRCHGGNAYWYIVLGEGASQTLTIKGHMGGKLGGVQLSGFGTLKYYLVQGASEWVRTAQTHTSEGPATIPFTLAGTTILMYEPGGKCNAHVSMETTALIEPTTTLFRHKKQHWDMTNRVDNLTITTVQDVGGGSDCVIPTNLSCSLINAGGGATSYCTATVQNGGLGCVPASAAANACDDAVATYAFDQSC